MINTPFYKIDQVRADTPGCMDVIHFNNAGSSLPTQKTLDAMISYLNMEAKIGGYEAARLKSDSLSSVYNLIATLINAEVDEIAITQNATTAWDMAFYAIKFSKGDRILASSSEYISNIISFSQTVKRYGVKIEIIPNDEYGQLSISALKNMIDRNVKLIAVTHVPSSNGLVQPVNAVGKIAKETGIYYLLDACQSVGQMPIDVREIGCDFLSATGRKYLRGPRGTGFLYIRKALIDYMEPTFLDMHAASWTGDFNYKIRSDARRFESWEFNIAAKLGLGTAIDYALKVDISKAYLYIQSLAEYLRESLSKIKRVHVYDQGKDLCGIVTFTMENIFPVEVREKLMLRSINVSTTDSIPHWRMDDKRPALIRASVHYYNTFDEIERFVDILDQIDIH